MNLRQNKDLPLGWSWTTLGAICEFAYGTSLTAQSRQPGDVPVYGSNGIVGYHNISVTTGPTIIVGRKGSIGEVHYSPVPCWPIDTTYFISSDATDVNIQWLAYWLKAVNLQRLNKASGVPGLNRNDAYALDIPLPSLAEQKRIVTILTQKLAAIAKARAAAEIQLAAAQALPAAYLRQVFESEEAQGWPIKTVGEHAVSVQNGIYKAPEYYGHGEPFLRMYNIPKESWNISLHELAYVEVNNEEREKYGLAKNDLLISRVNSFELVGKSALVGPEAVGYMFENMLIRIRFDDSIEPLFIAQQMQTAAIRKQIERVAKVAIGQASINSTDLRNLELRLPSLSKQNEVAKSLTDKMNIAYGLKTKVAKQMEPIGALISSVLRQAFNGEL